ncbi:MAG: tetratricopeptide repeat protein [Bacteroidia bacterium]
MLLFSLAVIAQPKKGRFEVEDADEHFKHNNFMMALPMYRELFKSEPENKKIQYRLAVCYINTNFNRTEAIKHLEDLVQEDDVDENAWFDLGRAYHLAYRLDDAIKAFEKYKAANPKKAALVDRQIQMCNNAKQFMETPVNVSFTNLGKEINSDEPDYYPFVSADETFMAFTSRRKENIGGKKVEVDGYHPSDIYFSKLENGKWAKAMNPGNIMNTNLDEQTVGLKADATEMVIYLDHIDKFGDLYLCSKKNGGDFQKPKILPPEINAKIETSGSFGPEGNLIVFARRENVDSKSDIYMCRKLPTNKWSEAYKLPPQINTAYNEDFPFLSTDGVTLYFSSEGHNSMGGYDLFKSTWNPEDNTWSEAENLGYPINSTDNDRSISLTPDNRAGYISAFRNGGFGDLDIYRIRFNDHAQITRIITGKISLGDTISKPATTQAQIVVKNKNSGEEYLFVPNTKTGKYVIALGAGTYQLSVQSEGYIKFDEPLVISDLGTVEMEKNKNYLLKADPNYVKKEVPQQSSKQKNPKDSKPKPK